MYSRPAFTAPGCYTATAAIRSTQWLPVMRPAATSAMSSNTLSENPPTLRMSSRSTTCVVRDGIDPQVAHRAFLAIDEYRFRIAPDTEGAEFEDPPEED